MSHSRSTLLGTLVATLVFFSGCKTAYYAAYEQFGVYKRDLLKSSVVKARDEQAAAQEQFKDAMTRLKEITSFDGGKLEKAFTALKGEYDDCSSRASGVKKRIRDMEGVASDMFAEWEKELNQIGTPSLRESSREKLTSTRQRYEEMHAALVKAEQAMDPVLRQLNDYVLYLKHNLNAEAIASLKGEAVSVQTEISRLIEQMNASIARADEFVKGISK